jgi:IS1 family transposase
VDADHVCATYHDEKVRDVATKRVQCDEIWNFCYAKQKNVRGSKAAPDGAGSVWTWTALDSDSKLMVTWWLGDRTSSTATVFLRDLQSRLSKRIQLTTDGYGAYVAAAESIFGEEVDFAQLIKLYKDTTVAPGRYSPAECIGCKTNVIEGSPDPAHISTSHAERQNLTMRMSMRRYTRLTNAFSKKFENQAHMLALYFVHYNWIRKHKAHGKTPAMAAGLTDKALTMADVAQLIDVREQLAILNRRRRTLVLSN